MPDDPGIPVLSVVVPLFNEAANLDELFERVVKTLDGRGVPFELVLVDDGSGDGTLEKVRGLARRDARVRYVSFSRNFGHEIASGCGLGLAKGKAAILMDADLQDPPELIPGMLEKWREGNEVVFAYRRSGGQETPLRRLGILLFYQVMRVFSRVPFHPRSGDFRLLDRKVLDVFATLPERNRLVRGMVSWTGFRLATVEFDRGRRTRGRSSYTFGKLFLMARDGFFGFGRVPFWSWAVVGAALAAAGILGLAWQAAGPLLGRPASPGLVLTAWGLVFLGGAQLTLLGLVGEFVWRIHDQVLGRPLYVVKETNIPGAGPAGSG